MRGSLRPSTKHKATARAFKGLPRATKRQRDGGTKREEQWSAVAVRQQDASHRSQTNAPARAHAQAWTEAKRRDAKREELLALIEGCGVEPVLEAASQKVLKTDPTRAKAALKKLDFAAHAARCGLQKGQPAAAQAALKTIEATATGLHRTVTAMADERDHFKYVAEELERRSCWAA